MPLDRATQDSRYSASDGLGQNYDNNDDKAHGKLEKEDAFEGNAALHF